MKKKITLFFLILVLLYATGGVFYSVYYKNTISKPKVTNVSTIKNYPYTLKSNATNLYKSEFKTLKANLEGKSINDEEYAKSIARMFIIDLYSISNKVNKYDVGGTEFVFPSAVTNYKENVEDTIYKYVEDNSNDKRNQELPIVKSIVISSSVKTTYKIKSTSYEGYKIKVSWTYIKDMGYDTEGEIIVIKDKNIYYVAEKN